MIRKEELTVERFAKCFDMAVLAPDTQEEAIRQACRDAAAHNLAAMYTTPCWTKVVAEELAGCQSRRCHFFPLWNADNQHEDG